MEINQQRLAICCCSSYKELVVPNLFGMDPFDDLAEGYGPP